MKLLARDVYWFVGIAERQVPAIYERLPQGWRAPMRWPYDVLDMGNDFDALIPEPPSMETLQEASTSDLITVVVR